MALGQPGNSMGLSNGNTVQGLDPSQLGATDPQATADIPHIPTPDPGQPLGTPPSAPPQDPPTKAPDQLRAFIESKNIAEKLDKDKLTKIGRDCQQGFDTDLDSRSDWSDAIDDWMKLASQIVEEKTWPWMRAANIKYPMISTAAMQFSARAYPSLVPSDGQVVKTQVIGKDPTGKKKDKADRVSLYMSWQLMKEMHGWEEDMDKMLMSLSVVGMMYKKTYWDPVKKQNCSHSLHPKNLVVNYWAKCLEDAERISEVIEMSPRKLKEKQLSKTFLDVDLGRPTGEMIGADVGFDYQNRNDETVPYEIIEQHTYLDLDDSGYKKPFIVTFNRTCGTVLRIAARFDAKGIITGDDGKVIAVCPIQYYTKFGFIPNPDGSFYDIGFGHLLGPLNESVNTLINQLIDAGTVNNLQSGFIGKGLRLKMGETKFSPGEWKAVNATGDDLKKQIVPLPSKEPSNVLFQLMGSLITSGKELASIAEIFVGKMPGQNTPATTTMASVEQGMKVFTAVYKRVYRSLDSEFKKLFRLNEVYLDYNTYVAVLDTQVDPSDFDDSQFDISPGADPAATSQSEKLVKAQGLMEVLPLGTLDPLKVTQRLLDAMQIPNWQDLISPSAGQPQQQQPDPQMIALQQKQQAMEQEAQNKAQQQQVDQAMQQRDAAFKQNMAGTVAQNKAMTQQATTANQLNIESQANAQRMAREQAMHDQKMQQNAETHTQQMELLKQKGRQQSQSQQKSTQAGNHKK